MTSWRGTKGDDARHARPRPFSVLAGAFRFSQKMENPSLAWSQKGFLPGMQSSAQFSVSTAGMFYKWLPPDLLMAPRWAQAFPVFPPAPWLSVSSTNSGLYIRSEQ